MRMRMDKNIHTQKDDPVIIGVCLGWDAKPHLAWSDGTYLSRGLELLFNPEYFPGECEWPIDPKTGQKMKIVDFKHNIMVPYFEESGKVHKNIFDSLLIKLSKIRENNGLKRA